MSVERWAPVEGHNGMYEVSDAGRLRSLHFHRSGGVRELSLTEGRDGYLRVLLKHGQRKCYTVHRLVAKAFVSGEGAVVNHKDGNKSNNSWGNLEWTSQRLNIKHAKEVLKQRTGRRPTPVVLVCTTTGTRLEFSSQAEAAKSVGLDRRSFYRVLNGECTHTKGYQISYKERKQ